MFRYMMLLAVAATFSTGHSEVSASTLLPADRHVTVDGVSLHYLDWGETGEPLVFLPPGCETAHIFGDIAPAFADRFRVVGPTTRGCGQSGRADAYDVDTQVKEIALFLDALGLERATVAGFSASGGKATRFARQHPTRVRRLVIFDSVYSTSHRDSKSE